MKECACLVVPSEWYEAFPHVMLEAMACGKPIVAARIGTLSDVVVDGLNGATFAPGDPSGLAEAVMSVISVPDRYADLSARSRQEFLQKYDSASAYKNLIEIYSAARGHRCPA
jgi:glycosyltransferase involved in cell wall biosynthesis